MRLGVIGFGEIGRSISTGLIKSGFVKSDILVYDKADYDIEKAELSGIKSSDAETLVKNSEIIFLAFSKNDFAESDFDYSLFEGKIVVSCISDVSMSELKSKLNTQVVRMVTTFAARNCNSVIGVYFDEILENRRELLSIFNRLGTVICCKDEDELKKIISLSACGLCYAAFIMDSFISTAEHFGLDRSEGTVIMEQIFKSAMDLGDYDLLATKIASHSGITLKGLQFLSENNVDKSIDTAFKTSYGALLR